MNISYSPPGGALPAGWSQPLNPKNLESSFPLNYSRFPISIGINDHLLETPQSLAAADRK